MDRSKVQLSKCDKQLHTFSLLTDSDNGLSTSCNNLFSFSLQLPLATVAVGLRLGCVGSLLSLL